MGGAGEYTGGGGEGDGGGAMGRGGGIGTALAEPQMVKPP